VRLLRTFQGLVVGVVAWAWLRTLRLTVIEHPSLAEASDRPWVLAFFHGTQWPLLAWKRPHATVVLVSHSSDGAIQAAALSVLGLRVVRGSSSRGGVRGLVELVRSMRKDASDAAFAVDGPRGPEGVAKDGAIVAARLRGGLVVPMGASSPSGLTLTRAWDQFRIAWPFSRVSVVLGAPLDPRTLTSVELSRAIEDANRLAWAVSEAHHDSRATAAPRRA